MIRILSLPSRHPYMSKFNNKGGITFINPNTDYFNKIGGNTNPIFLDQKHPPDTYDLVHIHFSFDKLSIKELVILFKYFKKNNKPVVWTCHSRVSQREKNIGKGKLQKILYEKSDSIITLTNGCKKWINKNLGTSKSVTVIPHGYILNPEDIGQNSEYLNSKKKENFIYLVGDLRKNKEIFFSIKTFLECEKLRECTLTVIFKKNIPLDKRGKDFILLLKSNRINKICLPELSNELLNKVFCESHVCMLPYLWGTHSGQIELGRDCGCYPVISDVGFYKQQYNKVILFKFDPDLTKFSNNLVKSLIKAYNLPILKADSIFRKKEFKKILKQHTDVYKKLI
jgi:hypothetical protein